jgi:hypothetical protein
MNFHEKNKTVGHLEIIKIDSRTGKEEVIFEDHNVITQGLRRALTQIMTRSECMEDPCEVKDGQGNE